MLITKVILSICLIAMMVRAKEENYTINFDAIEYEPIDETKFLGAVANRFSLLTSFTEYLMSLF